MEKEMDEFVVYRKRWQYQMRVQLEGQSSVDNPWLYCSKRQDKESGLVYFGRRYYHPRLGSWITPDPAGAIDRPNLYSFLRANPLAFFDALGFSAEERATALEMRRQRCTTSPALTRGVNDYAIKPVGYGLYHASYHLPIPYVRDALVNTGAFIAQNSDMYAQRSKTFYYPGNGTDPYPRLFLFNHNGMLNTPGDVAATSKYMSQKFGGQSVTACYSSTHGMLNDLLDCTRLWCGVQTHATDVSYNMITKAYDTMKNTFQDGKFLLAGLIHSRANLAQGIGIEPLAEGEARNLATFANAGARVS